MLLLAAVVVAVPASHAAADIVFDLKQAGLASAQPGQATTFNLAATNTGTVPIELAGIKLGLQILPQGLVTGTATISSIGVPTTGSPWVDPSLLGPSVEELASGPVNGSSSFTGFLLYENDLEAFGTIAPGETFNLAAVTITASADTTGLWNLYAVSEADQLGTVTSEFTDPSLTSYQFSNLVAPAYPDPGTSLTVQSIQYVPEPTAAMLCALGTAAVSSVSGLRKIHVRRRARCRTAQRSTTDG